MPYAVFPSPAEFVSATPLRRLLPDFVWPEDAFEGGSSVLDRIVATDWTFLTDLLSLTLEFEGELSLRLPGVDGLEVVANPAHDGSTPRTVFGAQFVPRGEGGWLLTLTDVSLELRWDSSLLEPVELGPDGEYVPTGEPFAISLGGSLTVQDDWSVDLGGCSAINLDPVRIGSTGIVVSAENLKLDFSLTDTPPEVAALGFGPDFRGLYVGECTVHFPAAWAGKALAAHAVPPRVPDVAVDARGIPLVDDAGTTQLVPPAEPVYVGPRLTLTNCAIGSGGFSGDIAFDVTTAVDAPDGYVGAVQSGDLLSDSAAGVSGLSTELYGFGLAVRRAAVSLRRTAITAWSVDGALRLPFLDTWLDVEVALLGDGAFEVTFTEEGGGPLATVDIPDAARIEVDRVGISDQADAAPGLVVSGSVTPLLPIGGGDWPTLQVDALTIRADGSVALAGGWIDLPSQATADFFGFPLELTQIGFGAGPVTAAATGDDWRWVGLSGAIRLVDELPLRGSVDGLKIAWRPAPQAAAVGFEIDWTLDGIGVDLDTGAFTLNGVVRFVEDDSGGSGFQGSVELALTELGLTFDAEFAVGRTGAPRPFGYWGAVLGVDLPFGVPLGPTGIAVYGLAGAGMQNMAPTLAPGADWYDDWYLPEDASGRSGVTLEKFAPQRGALGFGLGITLGTAPDNGFTVNAKAVLLILFPGPTIIITGRAGYLSPRAALAGDAQPPFGAQVVIDGADGSVLLNVAAHYSPLDPQVLDISGDAEAYFPTANPSDWYLHLGEKPLDSRISASILSLFTALAYLELSQTRLAAGFTVGFDDSYRFGPLQVKFDASIGGDGALHADPLAIRGDAELAGGFTASAFGVTLGLTASAGVAARAHTPLDVSGDVGLAIDLPAPLPSFSPEVHLGWTDEGEPDYADPFKDVRVVHAMTAEEWEPAEREADAPYVPLDGRPVVTFSHALADLEPFGQPATCVLPPAPEQVGDDEITYTLTRVALEFRPGGDGPWTPVDPLPCVWLLEGDVAVDDPGDALPGSRSATKLELLGRTPFDYEEHATSPTLSEVIAADSSFPCGPPVNAEPVCVSWRDVAGRTRFGSAFANGEVAFTSTGVVEVAIEAAHTNGVTLDRALALPPNAVLTATLPGPCGLVTLVVESLAEVVVEAHGGGPGDGELLATHVVGGRERGAVVFRHDGIERIILRAFGLAACLPWSWQRNGGPVAPLPPVMSLPDPPLKLRDDPLPPPITTVPCCSLLYQLCYLLESDAALAATVQERQDGFLDWLATWSDEAPVLAPNTSYRMTVAVEAAGAGSPRTFTQVRHFRTAGPPGFLHDSDDGRGALLGDLALYLDHTSPPAGAGLSLAAPPHYRAHDIVVLYDRDYVSSLYAGQLFLELRDQNGVPVGDPAGKTDLEATFADPSHQSLTLGESIFKAAVDAAWCVQSPVTPCPADSQGFTVPPLGPAQLYRARVLGGWSSTLVPGPDGTVVVGDVSGLQLREVLAFEFVTSRYEGFTEHAASYDAGRSFWDGDAALRPALDEPAIVAALAGVAAGAWSEAERAAGDRLEDLLALPGRAAPAGVELTVVRAGDGAVALLLDSPEPFDWSRLTVALSHAGNALAEVLVRLRDGRRALVFRQPSGSALGRFQRGAHELALDYDLAVAPARYRGGVSGVEHGRLEFSITREAT